ncbi:MAG: gluconate 2-dehydrogenase subunit 3 family protein [Cytophagales bacterium]|nr:gluconate 2-dehydrogenase subunit 3 family protein [Cytophagales bacterium]
MKRREAVQRLGMSLGAMVALPSWAHSWSKEQFNGLEISNEELLGSIVETIIPETETPGAKTVGAHLYIARMVKDCYSSEVQNQFQAGLKSLEKLGFVSKSAGEREQLLQALENSSKEREKEFFAFLKNHTLRSYMSSEFYLNTYKNYNMAPGFYHGCVPV